MKSLNLPNIYAGIVLAVLALIVVHAPLSVFFGSQFADYALIIKAWKEILLLVALILMAVVLTRAGKWRELFSDRVSWLVAAFVALHLVSLAMWNGTDAVLAGLAIDLRYVAYFVLVYVLLWLYPRYKRLFLRIALIGAIVVIGYGALQIFLPPDTLKYLGYGSNTIEPYLTIDQNSDFVRLQSTLRGPNPYGAYAASVAIIAAAWLSVRRVKFDWRLALLGVAAVLGTYLSYARSAYLALAAGLGIVTLVRFGRKVKSWQWLGLAAASVAIIAGGFMLRDTDFVSNVVLHEDPEEGGQVNSNDGHWQSLIKGLGSMARQPLGEGIGSTGSASLLTDSPKIIENQYLLIAHEVGWAGLGLFVVTYTIIMRRLWRARSDPLALGVFASGVGLSIVALLLPVWVDDTVSIVWWGLAAAVLATHSKIGQLEGSEIAN